MVMFWEVDLTDKEKLERWEQYRAEMERFQGQMAKLAQNFLELQAYDDAARCAGNAAAARFICGRMPHNFDT
jgi:hypothetical protein